MQSEEIFENLRLVLGDLELLRKAPLGLSMLLGGTARRRFYLLVRTYYYEFYRIRETLRIARKRLAAFSIFDPEQLKTFDTIFSKRFRPVVQDRNLLVHHNPTWSGDEHFYMAMADIMDREFGGGGWISEDTKEPVDTSEATRDAIDRILPHLVECTREAIDGLNFVAEALAVQIKDCES